MAFERNWPAVPIRLLTSDGGSLGQIQVADTRGFKVKQIAVLNALSLPERRVEIKRVLNNTTLLVGDPGAAIGKYADVSAYTLALSSAIYAGEQAKVKVPRDDRDYATYEQEPTVAWRNVLVDEQGNFWGSNNPMPVSVNTISGLILEPAIANVNMLTSGTEYSFAFPNGTVKFLMKIRSGNSKVQFAYVSGNTSTTFFTMRPGCFYGEETDLTGKTIYFQATKPNEIMEILYWTI